MNGGWFGNTPGKGFRQPDEMSDFLDLFRERFAHEFCSISSFMTLPVLVYADAWCFPAFFCRDRGVLNIYTF